MTNPENRMPGTFPLTDEATVPSANKDRVIREPGSFDDVVLTADENDPFSSPQSVASIDVVHSQPRFPFAKIALGAFSVLLSMAIGLWIDQLIRDLFIRSDWLGYAAMIVIAIGILAIAAFLIREIKGFLRLAAVQVIKSRAIEAITNPHTRNARQIVAELALLLSSRPETAKGRAVLEAAQNDVIDAPHWIDLAERELLSPLDQKARALILASSKRVSVVTAVSPRALVDLVYVGYEVMRLIRAMADLYGGRPGTLGLLRLLRNVIAHLAVTGSIAIGDSLVQQVLGHGLASRLSARLGEGVINGLMTARIGIAAMDLCRPLAFRALKRPGLGDFLADLTPSLSKKKGPEV